MTRRAFLSSKSNIGAGEIEFKQAYQKVIKIDHKNEDISESVNSIDRGAIFLPRSGQDLSRNASVVSVYALWKKFDRRKDFFLTPKNVEISPIFEVSQNRPGSF